MRHSDYGEADRLLVFFTRELGKVRAIAKGVRKPRSRKGGHLESFTRTRMLLAKGRNLFIVAQAEAVEIYFPIYENLALFGHASYVAELLDRFVLEGEAHPDLYTLLVETLQRLAGEELSFTAVRYFELRLLDLIGFRPQFYQCVGCQTEIHPEDQYFSYELGGVLCPKCGKNVPRVRPVSLDALRFLRHYQRSSYRQAKKAKITPSIRTEMESLMQGYLTYLLERGLNSPSFLRKLRRDDGIISAD